jgi:Rieske 2Fe-2S family protein
VDVPTLQAALPGAYYVDPEHFRRERRDVLQAEWCCVGRVESLGLEAPPGRGRLAVVDVAGESVLVVRQPDGSPRAYANVCRHRGSQVVPVDPDVGSPAACDVRALRCPYHSWTYGLDGRLLRAPHTEDVDGLDPAGLALHPLQVDVWSGFVFVRLAPGDGRTLADALGAVPGRVARYGLDALRVGARLTYDVRANYKVVLENYNECYHCAGVHPELTRLVPDFARGGRGLDWDRGVEHRPGAWTFTRTGTTARAPLPGLDPDERVRHKGELVYPNLLLSLSADHVAAFVLEPLAADRTRVVFELLLGADEVADLASDPGDAVELWDLVNRQDWAVCESVQRGMSSRFYTGGWFAPMEDDSLDIRRWLLPRLGEQVP